MIKVQDTLGVLRKIDGTGGKQRIHIQRLSTTLTLHAATGDTTQLPLLPDDEEDDGHPRQTLMLTRSHLDIPIADLNAAWIRGQVDWQPWPTSTSPRLMFCEEGSTCDILSVGDDARNNERCACLWPWGGSPPDADVKVGDLVELKPANGDEEVDVCTRLAKVLSLTGRRRVKIGKENTYISASVTAGDFASQSSSQKPSVKERNEEGSWTEDSLRLKVRLYIRVETPTGHKFTPEEGALNVLRSKVVRIVDPCSLPPEEVRLDDAEGPPTPDDDDFEKMECTDLFSAD